MPSVAFHTLGCKLNHADTQRLARSFADRGFEVVKGEVPVDVTVINSCSVTDEADRKCRQLIRRTLSRNPETFVVVTGCYAQLQPGPIAAIPGVDLVVGMRDKFRIPDLASTFTKQERTQVQVSCIDSVSEFEASHSTARTRAFVKIQDGCDYSCSFCTIPMARGRSRSQSIAEVASRARMLAAGGTREIVLSGVNIGLFGTESGESLIDLFRALDQIEGIQRYRISSIEPNLLTNEIVDFVSSSRSFAPHFHLPLQSGDDRILGMMRRRYQTTHYRDRVEYIRSRMPDACIGADVIVGFPGETEAHFLSSVEFINSLPLAYLHVFSYSERSGTEASRQIAAGQLESFPRKERNRRSAILRGVSEAKRRAFYCSQLGRTHSVLWEGKPDGGIADPERNRTMVGHTANYVKVQSTRPVRLLRTLEDVTLDVVLDSESGLVVSGIPDAVLPADIDAQPVANSHG